MSPTSSIEKTPRTYRYKGFRILINSHVLLALPIVNACAEHVLIFQSVLVPTRNRMKSTFLATVISNDIKSYHHFVGDLWVSLHLEMPHIIQLRALRLWRAFAFFLAFVFSIMLVRQQDR